MAETAVKLCKCEHKYQDEKYGKYYRVHNKTASTKTIGPQWRCTVCGAVK